MDDEQAQRLRRDGAALPAALIPAHPARLPRGAPSAAAADAAHAAAVAAGMDGYVDPGTGLFCFTAAYHWDKGLCCDLGCRHCPWLDADARLRSGSPPADAERAGHREDGRPGA